MLWLIKLICSCLSATRLCVHLVRKHARTHACLVRARLYPCLCCPCHYMLGVTLLTADPAQRCLNHHHRHTHWNTFITHGFSSLERSHFLSHFIAAVFDHTKDLVEEHSRLVRICHLVASVLLVVRTCLSLLATRWVLINSCLSTVWLSVRLRKHVMCAWL